MALNQVILEGKLASRPYAQEATVEFLLSHEGGLNGKRRSLFEVEVWGGWSDLIADLFGAKKGDSVLVLGRLKEGRSLDETTGENRPRLKIRAVRVKLIKQGHPWPTIEEPDEALANDAEIPF
jgi:single-stranded DNA-binding protein